MDEQLTKRFLELIGISSSDIQQRGEWLNVVCPLASIRHGDGKDSHPSFYVLPREDKKTLWYCFGCSEYPEPLGTLLPALWACNGIYPDSASLFYSCNECTDIQEEDEDWSNLVPVLGNRRFVKSEVVPIPSEILVTMAVMPEYAIKYMRRRGVSSGTLDRYGVLFYQEKGCFAFPYTDYTGKVYMLRARIPSKKKQRFTLTAEMFGLTNAFPTRREVGCWFGASVLNQAKPIIVVESEVDALRAASLGAENVIAAGGAKVTKRQVQALAASRIFMAFDADLEGRRGMQRIARWLRGSAVVYAVDWSVVGCKDPGGLQTQKQLKEALKAAEFISA